MFVLHLFAFLHHSMLWPLSGLFMHHGIHGPRVAFAAAPKQIKGQLDFCCAAVAFLGLEFEWWP